MAAAVLAAAAGAEAQTESALLVRTDKTGTYLVRARPGLPSNPGPGNDGILWTYDDPIAIPQSLSLSGGKGLAWVGQTLNTERIQVFSLPGDGQPFNEWTAGSDSPAMVSAADSVDRAVARDKNGGPGTARGDTSRRQRELLTVALYPPSNTCAGTEYIKKATGQTSANYGLDAARSGYDDLNGFLFRADELAQSLLDEGISAMKIWPFDMAAERTRGQYISSADLRQALTPFEKIRAAVGERMDIMVEFHSMWQLLPAMQIARELAPFKTFWHEDPIRMDGLSSLKRYAEASTAPICASETLGSRWAFRDLLETGVAGIVMLDVAWCGGLSEARKIAAMAEAWHLPVAPHDCTGPVVLCASTHLSLNAPNALIQESVRAFYRTWYRDLVTALPEVRDGMITVPPGAGLGMELNPEMDRAYTVHRRSSRAS